MQKILYFNSHGYCTDIQDKDSIFTMMCDVPDKFETIGIPIEDFVCESKFAILHGRHITKGSTY